MMSTGQLYTGKPRGTVERERKGGLNVLRDLGIYIKHMFIDTTLLFSFKKQ